MTDTATPDPLAALSAKWRTRGFEANHCADELDALRSSVEGATQEPLFKAMLYAIASMENRLPVEAPMNAAIVREHIRRVTELQGWLFASGFQPPALCAHPPPPTPERQE